MKMRRENGDEKELKKGKRERRGGRKEEVEKIERRWREKKGWLGDKGCESWFLPVSLTSILDPLVSSSSSRIKPASNSTEDVHYTMQ